MGVVTVTQFKPRLVFLLYKGFFSVIEHTLALPTFSGTQVDRVERIKNEAIKTILGCTRDTAIAARGCLLDMTTIC